MDRLKGRVAFITGAGSGIARASARLFAQEGAKVVVSEINQELGNAAAEEIRAAGGDALFVQTDVTNEASVKNAVERAVKHYGKLNVLYNCAGGAFLDDIPVDEVDLKSVWDKTIGLNLFGTFLSCRYGIAEIKKAGGGTVINMASWNAVRGSSPKHVYSAAKGGIISLTRALAGTYALNGIRVNAISPAVVRTERSKKKWENPADHVPSSDIPSAKDAFYQLRIEMAKRYPFSVGEPEDIANIALFLASDESRLITGTTIMADGGRTEY